MLPVCTSLVTQEAANASADQKVREWLPLARRDSYRGGAVGGARLFTRPHFYFDLIKELHMGKEEMHKKITDWEQRQS